ncbi:hypothetical protein EYW49_04225 [Siculibacillus lacustris]|uniref:DUF4231 domain-containing protein n=1 Tax=Siculibacillus lacustris TaxID=1549641 RepID=A0A4Q9VVU8_9HYPH|nr:hypothetical protein [Siculibacillus lacustris]TBW40397.1 hypothetical protein EYW49_04225 [Siculibacillus lacustris]
MNFVPRPTLTFVTGVTGHRPPRLSASFRSVVEARMAQAFEVIDGSCAAEYGHASEVFSPGPEAGEGGRPYRIRLLTGFAEGTDQSAVRLAPRHWEVEAILPAARSTYEATFAADESSDGIDRREEFRVALQRAGDRVVELPSDPADPDDEEAVGASAEAGYARQGVFMLRQIDLLIAVWDGAKSIRLGGTGYVVAEALENGVPVLWLSATEDRAARLLLAPEDLDRETEPADALDGPLQDVIASLVRPPAPSSAETIDFGPRDRLDAFLRERPHRRCAWVAYDCLRRGWAFWRWRWSGIRFHDLDATRDRWRPFLDRAPRGAGFARRLETVLLPRFHAADQIATRHAHAYRSAYVLAYMLATFAVAVTLFSTLPFVPHHGLGGLRWKAAFVTLETAVIIGVIWIVVAGRRRHWHQRWLDARALAEQLRHARFLSLVGELRLSPRPDAPSAVGESWIGWYLRATIRELGLPFGSLDPTCQRKILIATRETEVAEQLAFNDANQATLEHLNHRLHLWGDRLFFAVAFVLVAYLGAWVVYEVLHWTGANFHAAWQERARAVAEQLCCVLYHSKDWLVFFAALLPAFGAALTGIRFTGDFEGFAERSRETSERLRDLHRRYARAEDRLEFDQTSEILRETANAMSEDLSGWRALYARKRLSLPA